MPVTFNSSAGSLLIQKQIGVSSASSARSIARLALGVRALNAADDAAAISIGNTLRADIAALRTSSNNVQQGVSLLQTADGGLQQIGDILVRMKSLATQSASGNLSSTERNAVNQEFQSLQLEIDRIAGATSFNNTQLLTGSGQQVGLNTQGTNVEGNDGFVGFQFDATQVTAGDAFEVNFDSATNNLTLTNTTTNVSQTLNATTPAAGQLTDLNFSAVGATLTISDQFDDTTDITTNNAFDTQVGAGPGQTTLNFQAGVGAGGSNVVTVNINNATVTGIGASGDISTQAGAATAVTSIDNAINSISTSRAQVGAGLSRLEAAGNVISSSITGAEAAKSVLLDGDLASQITQLTAQQLLLQTSVEALRNNNNQSGLLLRLLS